MRPPWKRLKVQYIGAVNNLTPDEVHVWRLSQPDEEAFAAVLAPDELERARRFHFTEDRRRFVAARGALRCLIARYTGAPASRVCFAYGSHGKPCLKAPGDSPLLFNVSHSGGFSLLGFALGREVGVDIQQQNDEVDYMPIAERCFSAGEMAALLRADGQSRRRAFYRLWARKEAYIKALGAGFSIPLKSFDVADDRATPPGWLVRDLDPLDGFAAAVATDGPHARISQNVCSVSDFTEDLAG
jgi:4'-phosphopantetheinyl transferase